MRRTAVAVAPFAVFALTVSCRLFLPIPDLRTAVDRAHELEPRCAGSSAEVPGPNAIDSVGPAYSYVHSSDVDPAARLRGARIHVKPLPGYGKESLGRAIECHQVRVILGAEPVVANDPYVLPDRWLDTDVDSDGDGFVVLVRVDEFDAAREVLSRARRFLGTKR